MNAEVKNTQDDVLFTELSEAESSEVNGGHWYHHRRYYRPYYGGYGYYYRPHYRPYYGYGYGYYRPTAYYYGGYGCGY